MTKDKLAKPYRRNININEEVNVARDDEAFQKFKEAIFLFLVIKLRVRILSTGEFDGFIRKFWDAEPNNLDTYIMQTGLELLPNDVIVMRLLAGANITDELIGRLEKMWFKNAGFTLFPQKEKK